MDGRESKRWTRRELARELRATVSTVGSDKGFGVAEDSVREGVAGGTVDAGRTRRTGGLFRRGTR